MNLANFIDINSAEEAQVELDIRDHSSKMLQKAVRRYIVRSRVLKIIEDRFEKIFDPKRRSYYYYDTVTDTSSWRKPPLLLTGDIQRISPTSVSYTHLTLPTNREV